MKARGRSFYLFFVVLSVVVLGYFFKLKVWESRPVIEWDVTQYYSYLPATFIYNDYSFEDRDSLWHKAHFKFEVNEAGDTLPTKMTSGLAYLNAPLFLAAHTYARQSPRYAANGFSKPYKFALLLTSVIFSLLGIWFLGKLLMLWFSETTAIVVSLAIYTGTNIPYYSFYEPISHVFNFALVSALLYWFFLYLRRQQGLLSVLLGITAGLILLIRPSNAVILLMPLLILFFKRKQLNRARLGKHLLLAVIAAFLVVLPQLIYWKHMSGDWIYYSYGKEGFFFSDPEIWKGLFSYRKGWFTYSPLLFLSIPGYYCLFKKDKLLASASLLTLAVAVWVVFSWWCWWYGGGFGARPMIDYLPLMALALAALTGKILSSRTWLKIPYFTAVAFLCFWSLFMNWQYSEKMIHYDSMSKELYWDEFLETELDPGFWQKLDPPDYEAALNNTD